MVIHFLKNITISLKNRGASPIDENNKIRRRKALYSGKDDYHTFKCFYLFKFMLQTRNYGLLISHPYLSNWSRSLKFRSYEVRNSFPPTIHARAPLAPFIFQVQGGF
jgi:hypothetical protein